MLKMKFKAYIYYSVAIDIRERHRLKERLNVELILPLLGQMSKWAIIV